MNVYINILLPNVVIAVLISGSLSSKLTGKSSDISSNRLIAACAAISYPSAIRIGCIPLSNNCSACSNNAPAKTTTPVVPNL